MKMKLYEILERIIVLFALFAFRDTEIPLKDTY